MTSSNKVKGFAAGVIAAVCYGTNPLGTLELYGDGFNSSSVLIYRYLLAVAMFAVVMLFRKESFKVKWGHLIRLATLGCMFSLSSATLYVSFHYMAAGIASTILFVYPIMTAILMTVFFHEKVTWSTTLAILLAVSGVGLLYQGDGNDKLSTAGFALVIVAALFALHHLGEPVEESGNVEHQVHLLHPVVRTHHDVHLFVYCRREDSDAADSYALALCCPAGVVANGTVALLHDDFHQSYWQYASRHHGSPGACNGSYHRRLHLRREFLLPACHRHPCHPCWCHDYYCQEEIMHSLKQKNNAFSILKSKNFY